MTRKLSPQAAGQNVGTWIKGQRGTRKCRGKASVDEVSVGRSLDTTLEESSISNGETLYGRFNPATAFEKEGIEMRKKKKGGGKKGERIHIG